VLAFPGIRFAGVDVAISQSGPIVIELNTSPDRIGAAFVGVPTRNLFQTGQ
jgi:glutathione synthase/RimK-type ligase-like ATP-grasp enzyme